MEGGDSVMNQNDIRKLCEDHMHRYVMVTTQDNQQYDGIVENVDDDNLYLAVPNTDMDMSEQMVPPGYGGFGYGYDPSFSRGFYPYGFSPYPYPFFRPRRRFRRFIFPLAAITALSLLPYY